MAEKRNIKRLRKRLTIKFGLQNAERVAFTEDISHHGMFIKTANVASPGSKIRIELSIDDNCIVNMEAQVMWAKRVPANMLQLVKKSGMGIRILGFISGEDAYNNLCMELHAR